MQASPITSFFASQSVNLVVPSTTAVARHYLRQPHRTIDAVTGTSRIDSLGDNRFRLTMRPLSFLALTFQPVVDLRVWTDDTGTVRLRSLGCEIRGIEFVNHCFTLELFGYLKATEHGSADTAALQGIADLSVRVELPPPLRYMPRSAIESAGNRLLKGVLGTIERRLARDLVADYCCWVERNKPHDWPSDRQGSKLLEADPFPG